MAYGVDPVAKSTFAVRSPALKTLLLANVTRNGTDEYAVWLPTVTVIGLTVAPVGTVTVNSVVDAAVTVARTAPKYTTSLDVVALKFVPVSVTLEPIAPLVGVNDVIVGGEDSDDAGMEFLRTEITVLL